MGIMEDFLNIMRLNDDYDEDFEEEEEEEEEPPKPKKKSSRKENKEPKEVKKEKKEEPKKNISKITPINKNVKKQNSAGISMEVCVIRPNSIEEEVEVVDTLLEGRTVLINMEGMNVETAQRIIDFTFGATYAMNGNLQKVSNYIFLATPNGVDISGDIQNIVEAIGSGSTLD